MGFFTWTDAFELVGETRRIPADWKKWRRKWKRDQRLACRDESRVWREEWAQKRGQHRPHNGPQKGQSVACRREIELCESEKTSCPLSFEKEENVTSDEVCSTQTGKESDGMGERNG